MMKYILFLVISTTLGFFNSVFAYEVDYEKNIPISETLQIGTDKIKNEIVSAGYKNPVFEWELSWVGKKKGEVFERTFEKSGEKIISLRIFADNPQNSGEKIEIFFQEMQILVYEKSIWIIFDKGILEQDIEEFIDIGKKSWVLISPIFSSDVEWLETIHLDEKVKNFDTYARWIRSDYIVVWWEKDFLFSVLSKINNELEPVLNEEKMNIVLISNFNIDILKSFLKNLFLNNKIFNKVILIPEEARFQTINAPETINLFEESLNKSKHNFVDLTNENKVSEFLFISKFINRLSEKWFDSKWIYILLIIPFIITTIWFFKHFIWLSPIWVIIPTIVTILLFKLWFLLGTWILLAITGLNLLLWVLFWKYNLQYTPKINIITITNIFFLIIVFNILFYYNLISLNTSDSLFLILFIVIIERFISIVLSKEFREYRGSIFNTYLVAIFCFLVFQFTYINIFLLAYPEIILLLIPINFLIWKFTGLRVTEYFRFREIIKTVEE